MPQPLPRIDIAETELVIVRRFRREEKGKLVAAGPRPGEQLFVSRVVFSISSDDCHAINLPDHRSLDDMVETATCVVPALV